jgi:deaminated glutathione amidase
MTRVAALQMTSGTDVARNLAGASVLLREAHERGARIAALPENFAYMGVSEADKLAISEAPGTGPIQSFLAATASELGMWIVAGTIPMRLPEEPRVAAACLVYDDLGRAVARYDKIHLFDVDIPGRHESYRESVAVRPASSPSWSTRRPAGSG